jgi:hypothetical protein
MRSEIAMMWRKRLDSTCGEAFISVKTDDRVEGALAGLHLYRGLTAFIQERDSLRRIYGFTAEQQAELGHE